MNLRYKIYELKFFVKVFKNLLAGHLENSRPVER